MCLCFNDKEKPIGECLCTRVGADNKGPMNLAMTSENSFTPTLNNDNNTERYGFDTTGRQLMVVRQVNDDELANLNELRINEEIEALVAHANDVAGVGFIDDDDLLEYRYFDNDIGIADCEIEPPESLPVMELYDLNNYLYPNIPKIEDLFTDIMLTGGMNGNHFYKDYSLDEITHVLDGVWGKLTPTMYGGEFAFKLDLNEDCVKECFFDNFSEDARRFYIPYWRELREDDDPYTFALSLCGELVENHINIARLYLHYISPELNPQLITILYVDLREIIVRVTDENKLRIELPRLVVPNELNDPPRFVNAQDDLDPHDTGEASNAMQEHSSVNVDLIENRGTAISDPMQVVNDIKVIGNQLVPLTFPELTGRLNNMGTIEWSTGTGAGVIIDRFNLPIDLIAQLGSNPATLPLLQHLYYQPQITMYLQCNATAFHQGQLIVGMQYYPSSDSAQEGTRVPTSAYQIVQLDSARINAASSNIVELNIPFQSPFQMLPIRHGNLGSSNYYASVFIGVLSPLNIGAGGSTSVTITRQVKLECKGIHTQFFGQQTRQEIFAQDLGGLLGGLVNMIPGVSEVTSAVSAAGGFLDEVIKPVEGLLGGLGKMLPASNMDRPLKPVEAESRIIYPVCSLSNGDGQFTGKSLRLNPSMITPHHPATIPSNGTLLMQRDIIDKWGYVDTFTISRDVTPGSLLYTHDVSPFLGTQISVGSNLGFLPIPLAGVANLFQYWHGSIVFKFIFVKANPHSLRVRFCTNPTNAVGNNKGIDLFSTVQDIQEITEIDYEVPFMGPTAMLPVKDKNNYIAAGRIQVFAESQLITMNSVADAFDVLVFAKAGSDFKFSVPRPLINQPLVTSTITTITLTNYLTTAVNLWTGNSGEFDTIGGKNLTANGTWSLINPSQAVELDFTRHMYLIADGQPTGINITGMSSTPNYFVVVEDITLYDSNSKALSPAGTIDADQGSYRSYYTGTGNYSIGLPSFAYGQDEREEESNPQGPSQSQTFLVGQTLTGETFEVRTSLRRFETVLDATDNYASSTPSFREFSFDLNYGTPYGRDSNSVIDALSYFHDAFRFGKGSLRFNLIVEDSNRPDIKFWVYHLPPGFSASPTFEPTWVSVSDDHRKLYSLYGHEIIANSGTTVPFEVPYYNWVDCLVNGYDPNNDGVSNLAAYSFGKLCIIYHADSALKFTARIERALGDDADLYVFQGFPPLFDAPAYTNINDQTLLPAPTNSLTYSYAQDEFESQDHQDFCKSQPSSWSNHLSRMIESHRTSRRGRLALKKYFSKFSKLNFINAQDGERPDCAFEHLIVELADAYNKRRPVNPIYIDNPRISIKPNNYDLLTKANETDSDFERRVAITEYATLLSEKFPELCFDFFRSTSQTNSNDPWYSKIGKYCSKVNMTIPETVKSYVKSLDNSLQSVPSTLFGILKTAIPVLVKTITCMTNLYYLVTNFQMLISASDGWVKCMAMTSLLQYFGFIESYNMGLALVINELIYYCSKRATAGYMYMYAQDDEETTPEVIAQYTAALIGGVSGLCGLSGAKTWDAGIKAFSDGMSRTTNAWHTLLTKSCTFIMDYILWLLGKERPEELALREFKDLKIDGEQWTKDVLYYTEPSRRDTVLVNNVMRAKIANLYETGSVIIKTLGLKDGTHPKAGVILSLWKRLVDLYSETGEVPDSIKANKTPICIWLTGKPGIGKSEAAKTLACKLALLLNISFPGDPFFVRRPRKFWDGYTGQPIIIFDDACQLKDPTFTAQFLEDWYGVMTPAPFSPEFSTISEKKKFVTPEIVICTSNEAFPKVSGVSDISSFHRRRDFVIEVTFSEDLLKSGITSPESLEISTETLQAFEHLRFRQFGRSSNLEGLTVVQPSLGPVWKMGELVSKMQPKLEHLRSIRTKSAETQVALSKALDPLTIAKSREELIKEISNPETINQVVGSLASAVGQTVSMVTNTQDCVESIGLYQVKVCEDSKGLCSFNCQNLPEICISTVVKNEWCYRVCEACECVVAFSNESTYFGSPLIKRKVYKGRVGSCSACPNVGLRHAEAAMVTSIDCYYHSSGIDVKYRPTVVVKTQAEAPLASVNIGNGFWSWLFGGLKSFWDGIPWKYLIGLLTCIGFYFVLKSFDMMGSFKRLLAGEPDQGPSLDVVKPVAQMAVSGGHYTRGKARREYFLPQESVDDLVPRIKRNFVKYRVRVGEGYFTCWGLGLFNRTFVTPFHTIHRMMVEDTLPPDGDIDVTVGEATVALKCADIDVTRIHSTDLCIITILNRRIPCFKNMLNTLVKKEELGHVSNLGLLVDVRDFSKGSGLVLEHVPIKPVQRVNCYLNANLTIALHGYEYPREGSGMCGSILIDRRTLRVIGMHTSGLDGLGYSTTLTSEYFKNCFPVIDVAEPEVVPGEGKVKLNGEFIPIGIVPQDKEASLPLTSGIMKATTFGVLRQPERKPVCMFDANDEWAGSVKLEKAISKEGKPTLPWPLKNVNRVKQVLTDMIVAECPPVSVTVGVRTIEDAIVGVSELPFAEALKRSTAVGWPLSSMGLGTQKRHFVDYREEADGLCVNGLRKELVQIYNLKHDQRKRGIIPFSVYHDFLKDERLKPGKNPRLINGCPMEQVIDSRRYLMDFGSAVQAQGRNIGIYIGVNVHGMEWSVLANSLLAKGSDILCGDYSGFGPGLDTELVLACGEIVDEWYSEYSNPTIEDKLVRKTLFENLAFSYEIAKDTVYQTVCGSPSGNAYTALINSLVNLMYMGLSWMEVFKDTTIEDPKYMWEFMQLAVYGDDIIASVSPMVIESFNNVVLQRVLGNHGIVYTDASKTGEMRESCSIADATFLKSHFLPHPTRGDMVWLAGLEKGMIEDIPNWINKKHTDPYEASLENSYQTAALAYAWGKEYYKNVCDRLRAYWVCVNRPFIPLSWDYLDRLYFGELKNISLPKEYDPANFSWV